MHISISKYLTCTLLGFSKFWIVAQIAMAASSPVHITTAKLKKTKTAKLKNKTHIKTANTHLKLNQSINQSKLLK